MNPGVYKPIKSVVLPADTKLTCKTCGKKADLFVGHYHDILTSLTVDNSGLFLCVECAQDYVEANK